MGGGIGPTAVGEKWRMELEFTGAIGQEQADTFNAALTVLLKFMEGKAKITKSKKEQRPA